MSAPPTVEDVRPRPTREQIVARKSADRVRSTGADDPLSLRRTDQCATSKNNRRSFELRWFEAVAADNWPKIHIEDPAREGDELSSLRGGRARCPRALRGSPESRGARAL